MMLLALAYLAASGIFAAGFMVGAAFARYPEQAAPLRLPAPANEETPQ